MVNNFFVRVMAVCTRHPWVVVISAALLTVASGWFVATNFRINTDITSLISTDLPWRQRELALQKAFPQTVQDIYAVVEAATPERVSAASKAFLEQLQKAPEEYRAYQDLNGGEFFDRNGLLLLPLDVLKDITEQMKGLPPLLSIVSADPSTRGIILMFEQSLAPAQQGIFDSLPQDLNKLAFTIEDVLAGHDASFSWQTYLTGKPASAGELRGLFAIWPKLDFSSLEPGRKATDAVRAAAQRADLGRYGARLRLTGPVPIADEEFATLKDGAALNGIVTGVLVLAILFLALRSVKIVIAVAITLAVGLVVAAAAGILLVGAFNPISVAFAVLFIGLGADFAIQFSVRYRAERNERGDLREGLVYAARWVGAPLTLAAAAAAAGFMSFLPTPYRGMAELGKIAGFGMLVAYLSALLLLPALLQILNPPAEPEPLGYRFMAPVDRFLARHRIAVVLLTSLLVVAGGIVVFTPPTWVAELSRTHLFPRSIVGSFERLNARSQLTFDFDPLHLRNQQSEAVATARELSSDPNSASDTIEILAASPQDAAAMTKRLKGLPEVAEVRSINSFLPEQQDEKRAALAAAYKVLQPSLKPRDLQHIATDADNLKALSDGVSDLKLVADAQPGPGAVAANRLGDDLNKLIHAPSGMRDAAQTVFVQPLVHDLDQLPLHLQPQNVTLDSLPPALRQFWMTSDGRARVEVVPSSKPDRDPVTHKRYTQEQLLKNFDAAVLKIAPNAFGRAIGNFEWGATVKWSFLEAAMISIASIAVILLIVLRRVVDVLVTLIPLLVAAVATLEICALTHFPLNYANIIALPVLLGVGVAFKIYYVTAWRAGETEFLQSPLTRAVFFSALMTAVAFGSLSFSSHPGTASMGKLLALSLACTLASAALFQPALMGAAGKGAKTAPRTRV